ncbi:hypothetical protein [Acinetobacter higginsii]|uniref:hypothetical protein n=1 Tax=Acinetobacter higginsii TaxID=70347 RepID=UPI001F4BC087|nr:hypothetical protein [Acinetobacter higginsii]MCH7295468.1 hypothetical protein [Acinetobacter higginsii]
MNQGIPARDIMIDRNGQITSIWLIFFERLYSLYSDSSSNNAESIAEIREIANQAINLSKQVKSENETQQKEIDKLYELISQPPNNTRIEQAEYNIEQLRISLDQLKNLFNNSQIETKNKINDLQSQINNIDGAMFVDAPADGKTYGRKNYEWAEIVAVSLSLPFFIFDGSQQNIPLTSNYELPFFLADGTQQNIATVTV